MAHFLQGDALSAITFHPQDIVAIAGLCNSSAAVDAETVRLMEPNYIATVVGTAAECIQAIEAVSAEAGVAEVMFLDLATDAEHRKRTIQELAVEMALREWTA